MKAKTTTKKTTKKLSKLEIKFSKTKKNFKNYAKKHLDFCKFCLTRHFPCTSSHRHFKFSKNP